MDVKWKECQLSLTRGIMTDCTTCQSSGHCAVFVIFKNNDITGEQLL